MHVIDVIAGVDRFYEIQQWRTGLVLRPGKNPEGRVLPDGIEDAIVLSTDLPKIDAENWTATQKLYIWAMEELGIAKDKNPFHYGRSFSMGRNNEAGVENYLAEDLSHWITVVPRQVVGGASVDQDRTRGGINIITGEVYTQLPPPGYMDMGTGHSHNTMPLSSFSGTDDGDELCRPGWHILCSTYRMDKGGIWQYVITCSVVAGGKRYLRKVDPETWEITDMTFSDFVEINEHGRIPWRGELKIPEEVFSFITIEKPKDWKTYTGEWSRSGGYRLAGGAIRQEPLHIKSERTKDTINWGEFFAGLQDNEDDDFPGQQYLFDNEQEEELEELRKFSGDERFVRKYTKLELEGVLDGIARIEALLDSRMGTAQLVADALNTLNLWRKIKPRKNP